MLFRALYGIGPSASITGGPNAFSGRTAASPSLSDPQCAATMPTSFAFEPSGAVCSPATSIISSGKLRARVAEKPQHVERARQRMRDDAAGDDRPDRMEVVFERRRDAEVAAAAANRPEQIGVLVGACANAPGRPR